MSDDELRALSAALVKPVDGLTALKQALDYKIDQAIKDLHSGPQEMAMKELQESFEMHLKAYKDLDKAFKRGLGELKESGKLQKQALESLQTKFDEISADWKRMAEERDTLLEEYKADKASLAKLALTYKLEQSWYVLNDEGQETCPVSSC